jgi:hypothetical protein
MDISDDDDCIEVDEFGIPRGRGYSPTSTTLDISFHLSSSDSEDEQQATSSTAVRRKTKRGTKLSFKNMF